MAFCNLDGDTSQFMKIQLGIGPVCIIFELACQVFQLIIELLVIELGHFKGGIQQSSPNIN